MVGPVTGPFTKFESKNGHYLDKTWYRQRRPYNQNLTYSRVEGWGTNPYDSTHAWRFAAFASSYLGSDQAYAKAYSRVVDQLGENAGIGVTLAQWKQADQMVSNRVTQLRTFTYHLANRNPLGVAASLGIKASQASKILKTRHGVQRKLSDLWLEFWFGWKPAVQDIYTALEVFDDFIPWASLKGTGKASARLLVEPATPWGERLSLAGEVRCSVGIDVRLVNPNVRTLNQLGLLNPALIAWDAIPWSFVLGWVSNIDMWLSSFTDFAGFETSNGYVSRRCLLAGRVSRQDLPDYGGHGSGVANSRSIIGSLPRPALQLKGLTLRPARALTAIALLTQKLPRT